MHVSTSRADAPPSAAVPWRRAQHNVRATGISSTSLDDSLIKKLDQPLRAGLRRFRGLAIARSHSLDLRTLVI